MDALYDLQMKEMAQKVLENLARRQVASSGQICDDLNLSFIDLEDTFKSLEKVGLIERRTYGDPILGVFKLTRKGRQLVER